MPYQEPNPMADFQLQEYLRRQQEKAKEPRPGDVKAAPDKTPLAPGNG